MDERPDNLTIEDDVLLDQWLQRRRAERNMEERKMRLEAAKNSSSFGGSTMTEEFTF